MTESEAIVFRDVGMVFPGTPTVEALSHVSFQASRGEFLALVGPSGCGKSTLLRLIAGLLTPTSGNVSVYGKMPKQAQQDVEFGFVFQDPVLFPWMRVLDNVLLPHQILRRRDPMHAKDPERLARQLIRDVGLQGFERQYPEQLSGGMKQRVALARALAYQPSTLLMDEPFGALDEFTRDRLNLQLLDVWTKIGASVIFVTHSIQEAAFLADRVVVLSARPGHVVRIADIPFDRPRGFDVRFEPTFIGLVAELRHLLQSEEIDPDAGRT